MPIHYQDEGTGILKNTYTIHAVDKYNNPAKEGIVLHPSIINGTRVVRTSSLEEDGQIIQGGASDMFKDDVTNPFGSVDESMDLLAIVSNANRTDQAYLGNWTIDSVVSNSSLTLAEDYLGLDKTNLNYVIGNSERYVDGYGIATVDIKSATGSYVTDVNGIVQFTVSFDRILAGHTVTISANAYDVNRTGVAKIAGLRWDDYSSSTKKIQNDGADHNITLQLGISGGVEPLVGLRIDSDSIISNDATCDINASGANILTTDSNGVIQVQLSTDLTGSQATECDISWNTSPGSIYREY